MKNHAISLIISLILLKSFTSPVEYEKKSEINWFHSGSPIMVDINWMGYYDDEIYEFEDYGENDSSSRNDYLVGINTHLSFF